MIVPLIERRVRLHEGEGGTQGDTDAPSLREHIVLETAHKPDTRRLLDDDDAEPQLAGGGRGPLHLGRLGLILGRGPPGCLRHASNAAIPLTSEQKR